MSIPLIERKTLLYKSGLGFYCINHAQGCSHGCRYPCYAFMMNKAHGRVRDYAEWCRPRLVGNALELLESELTRKRSLPACVHLCLSTDPFMVGQPEIIRMSLAIIERLNRAGISASLLTKGVLPKSLADRNRFPCENIHGISLVSLNEDFRRRWEPGAAPYTRRIAAARRLHEAGRRTLAHIEPYPTPAVLDQDLDRLIEAVRFVDHLYFGPWNYNAQVNKHPGVQEFYREAAGRVEELCRKYGIECELG